jgi:glycosyltransferase involved in cell wall biosynthesis
MTDGPAAACHFGPSTDDVGGMASVIATLVTLKLGAEAVRAAPTWRPGPYVRSAVLAARAVVTVLRLPRSTAVHLHMSAGGSFIREAAILAGARLRGMPRVVTIHGYDFAPFSERWPRLVSRVLGLATAITVLSESDLSIVRRLVSDVHVEVLPHPMPLDTEVSPVSDTSEVVLFGGEVGTRKGADVLHRAWPAVSAGRPAATCIVVGPTTALNLPSLERFEVRGPVSRQRIRELIREARVVALPSRGEALPMILGEAMAAGRPFVSTPTGGISSLAAGGILVPVDDDRALASALIELLGDAAHAQALGSAGRELCNRLMAPEAIDARLRWLYSDSMRSPRRQASLRRRPARDDPAPFR